jgi:hypothetical protein
VSRLDVFNIRTVVLVIPYNLNITVNQDSLKLIIECIKLKL